MREQLCQARSAADVVTRRYFDQGELIPASGTQLYYAQDQLGSVRDVVAVQNGARVASYDYEPYGNPSQTAGRIGTDFRFAGMFYESNSGIYLTRYRGYDPSLARWLSRDVIGESGGPNLYSYVYGSPTTLIDFAGLTPAGAVIGGAIGGVIGGFGGTTVGGVIGGVIGGRGNACCSWHRYSRRWWRRSKVIGADVGGAAGAGIGALVGAYLGDKISDLLGPLLNESNNDSAGASCPIPGVSPGRETKGRSKQFDKPGDIGTADQDFDNLNPENVTPIPNGGRKGTLPDGRPINVRPDSTDGRPTIEIQDGKNRIKVRYGPK